MKVSKYSDPYPYIVIEDFLPANELTRLAQSALSSVQWQNHPNFHDEFGMVTSAEVLRLMAGKPMKELLRENLGVTVKRHDNAVPQLRLNRGRTKGIPVHTDATCGYMVGVFLHLTDWVQGMGGDLRVWRKKGPEFELVNEVPPKANTLVILPFSEISFHSVSPVLKDVERVTLLSEWSFV